MIYDAAWNGDHPADSQGRDAGNSGGREAGIECATSKNITVSDVLVKGSEGAQNYKMLKCGLDVEPSNHWTLDICGAFDSS